MLAGCNAWCGVGGVGRGGGRRGHGCCEFSRDITTGATLSFADLYAATWPILVACGIMALAVLGTERVLVGRVHELIVFVA